MPSHQANDGAHKPLLGDAKGEPDGRGTQDAEPARKGISFFRLLEFTRPNRMEMAVAILSLFISTGTQLAIPYYFGKIVNILGDSNLNDHDRRHELLVSTLALLGFGILGSIFMFLRAFLFTKVGELVVGRIRKLVFQRVMQQEVGFFDENRVGELLSRIGTDTTKLKDVVTLNLSMGLRWCAMVLGGMVCLFVISPLLTVTMLVTLPIVVICAVIYGRYVKQISKDQSKMMATATEVAEESISGIRTVRSFANEGLQRKVFNGHISEVVTLGVWRAAAEGSFRSGLGLVVQLIFIGLVYLGGTLVLRGKLTAGGLTSFLFYSIQIGGALGGLGNLYGSILAAIGSNERVFAIIDRDTSIPLEGGVRVQPPTGHHLLARGAMAAVAIDSGREQQLQGRVEFDQVTFQYPTRPDAPVLRGLSLTIEPGQVAALVGPSGAGKSTTVALLERFYDVAGGSVRVDGREIREYDPSTLRRSIGFVQQEPTLFAMSIMDNIKFGRMEASDEEAMEAARQANADDFIRQFPDGYDTMVGERGVRLSGGQKQRVAIARAILKNPRILLLDEATSALDAESEHLVQEALDRLMVGRTTLLIAHRLSTVRGANCVHVVQDGVVAASGTHQVLMESSEVYANLVRRQLMQHGDRDVSDSPAGANGGTAAGGDACTLETAAAAAAAAAATGGTGPASTTAMDD